MDIYNLQFIRLRPHPTARDQAVAAASLTAGTVVVSVPSLSTVLLPPAKGQRCDGCHVLASPTHQLKKCSACSRYWYCGTKCQKREWKAHHRRTCQTFIRPSPTAALQGLSTTEDLDTILASQLVAEMFPKDTFIYREQRDGNPISIFMKLMKHPRASPTSVTTDENGTIYGSPLSMAEEVRSRFPNNNFMVHSHLTPYAIGIFPLASRLFNHSCVPNAVAKFVITPGAHVRMDVVALRAIEADEEITIPYVDPALPYSARKEALETRYGFTCDCQFCSFSRDNMQSLSRPPPRSSEELGSLESDLRIFAFGDETSVEVLSRGPGAFEALPTRLHPLLHETYLPNIAETFSRTSHEGSYKVALSTGRNLLALYLVLYPPNFPQIGMHAVEMAKTAWNAFVSSESTSNRRDVLKSKAEVQHYLDMGSQILNVLGEEGDPDGPLSSIRSLEKLVSEL